MSDITGRNKKWFKGVDSLRFILALIVVLSHFKNPFAVTLMDSPNFNTSLWGHFLDKAFDGTAAVIAFFIISGFVIHYPNKDGIKDLKTFWIRRFVRIFLPLIIVFIVGIKFDHPDKAVIWSLICELIYYALYPFMAMIKLSWRIKFIIAYIIAAVFIIFGAPNDLVSLFAQANDKYHGYYWQLGPILTSIIGLPVWLLGVLLAENTDKLITMSAVKVWLYRITVILLSCFFSIAQEYLYISFIVSMNIFALLVYKWLEAEIIYFKTREPNGVLEKMGRFSYSLYLCHPIIYAILGLWLSNNYVNYPIFIVATIIISYLFYLAIEQPSHLLAIRLSRKF